MLDVGTSHPFPFQVGMFGHLVNCEFYAIEHRLWEGSPTIVCTHQQSGAEFKIFISALDIEADVWPYEGNFFDLVIFTEVLEHLSANPLYVMREIYRCTKPDGLICLSTPNVACFESVAAILQSRSPYTFGAYSPEFGSAGHHNREFVPAEVEVLGAFSGFAKQELTTLDVYGYRFDLTETIQLLRARNQAENRGQVIFYIGSRVNNARLCGYPPQLYLRRPLMKRPLQVGIPMPLPDGRTIGVSKGEGYPLCFIDYVNGSPLSDRPIRVAVADELIIEGWAVDQSAGTKAAGVDCVIDGLPYRGHYFVARNDVAEDRGVPDYFESGFQCSMPAGCLTPGEHSLSLRVVSADRSCYYETSLLRVMVE